MKKLIIFMALVTILFTSCGIYSHPETKNSDVRTQGQKERIISKLMEQQPVPEIKYAIERKNVARRAELFDVENKLGYVYLFASNGIPIGYYTIFGRMSSLRSYLVPQEKLSDAYTRVQADGTVYNGRASGWYVMQDADVDGTYGENCESAFFFTDNGTYVEIPLKCGITPIYMDKPLPFLDGLKYLNQK